MGMTKKCVPENTVLPKFLSKQFNNNYQNKSMSDETIQFQLTADDKKRYEISISEIDLSSKEKLLINIPEKLNQLKRLPDLKSFQHELISDISTLYNLITTRNELTDVAQRRILFALEYFYESEDDIPDRLPWVGYLDDAVVTRWVLEGLIADYGKYFDM